MFICAVSYRAKSSFKSCFISPQSALVTFWAQHVISAQQRMTVYANVPPGSASVCQT